MHVHLSQFLLGACNTGAFLELPEPCSSSTRRNAVPPLPCHDVELMQRQSIANNNNIAFRLEMTKGNINIWNDV